ncbi:MAG: tyrosine-type recombinase/integrase [Alphaproteobacteria bacterium]|nr:tyrosine-type recombinase/integrase [Alphaproteobacteria bacterium]
MRLTDKGISALKAKPQRYEVWEDGKTGLGIRVSPAGRKSFVYMYRHEGKPRRMTLGAYPRLSLSDARVLYAQARQSKEKGQDPAATHVARKIAERQAETVSDLIEEYLSKHARPNKRSANEDERALRKDVEPEWGRKKAKAIKRRDVIKLIDEIVDRGSPIQANRTLAVIRRMFNFAIERDIIDATPCAMVKAPTKEQARDRVLSPDEIKTLWLGLSDAKMIRQIQIALKLMLVTAQRRDEVISAKKAEFNLNEAIWELPGDRLKNKRAHRVPLSDLALNILKEAWELSGESDWLFPNPKTGKPVTPSAVSHAVRNNLECIGLTNVRPHDLRRTAASSMTELGISRLVVAKILNHSDGSVTAVYDRYEYGPEKKRALDAWANRILGTLGSQSEQDTVVQLNVR